MNFNVSLIDQRLTGILSDRAQLLPTGNPDMQRSTAFTLLCAATCLELSLEEAADLLTEGSGYHLCHQ